MTLRADRSSASQAAPVLLDHEPTRQRPLRVVRRPPLERSHRIDAHRHPWPQITFALEGVFRVTTPDHSWVVPPSRAIWIPAMVEHEVVMLSRVVMHAVRVGSAPSGVCDRPHVIEVSPLLRESIIALLALGERPRPARMAALQTLILDEVRHSPALPLSIPLPKDKRLRSLCEQLIANPNSDRRLEDWARHIGASSRTVERLFNDALGVTFRQWRQSVRLAHAVAVIAQGRSIAYAAEAAGYATQSAFTAMFRSAFGKAPRDFVEGARGTRRRVGAKGL